LSNRSPDEAAHLVSAYREGLNDVGYSEGRNVNIEYRWAKGANDKLADLANDLISRQVSVIDATGGNSSAMAAKIGTKRIPIVFTSGSDPVAVGLVTNLSHPEEMLPV
jgi:putative ABC transport system substrate-binding protein